MSMDRGAPSFLERLVKTAFVVASGLPVLICVALRCMEGVGLLHALNQFAPFDIIVRVWAAAFILGYVVSILRKQESADHKSLKRYLHASSFAATVALAWDYASVSMPLWGHASFLLRFVVLLFAFMIPVQLLSVLGRVVRTSSTNPHQPTQRDAVESLPPNTLNQEANLSSLRRSRHRLRIEVCVETESDGGRCPVCVGLADADESAATLVRTAPAGASPQVKVGPQRMSGLSVEKKMKTVRPSERSAGRQKGS